MVLLQKGGKTMKIGIYTRKSLARQDKDSVSIDTQIEECKRLVRSGDTVQIYTDEGISGKTIEKRPAFQDMLNDVKLGYIDKIIVYKIDRFSRNITDFFNVYDELKKYHCGFESAIDKFDTTTPQGKFFMTLLAAFAELERSNISQRVKDSYYHRAKTDGRFLGGKIPVGFVRCKNADNKSSLKPNEMMELVVELYNKYSRDTTTSLHQLVGYAREKYNIKFDVTQIRNTLSNPVYVKADKLLYEYYKLKNVTFLNDESEFDGTHALQIVNKTDQSGKKTIVNDSSSWVCYLANWKGVIPSRTFIDVQERLKENRSYTSSNDPTNKMEELSGLVKCSKCGMAARIKGKYGTISCVGRSEYRGHCDASFKGIRLADIQEKVAIEIQTYFDNFSSKVEQEELQKKSLRNQIDKLKKEIDMLIEVSLTDELLRKATFDKIRDKQRQLSEIEVQYLNFNVGSDRVEDRVLKHTIRQNGEIIYRNLTTEQKQSLLKILVKKVFLSEDGSVRIEWK